MAGLRKAAVSFFISSPGELWGKMLAALIPVCLQNPLTQLSLWSQLCADPV